jgi:molecular chaperone DnaK
VPKIQVTFKLDADGIVSVEAKDLGTGKAQTVRVKPASGLSQSDVDKLVVDAEKFKDADEDRRELAEIRNQAETLVYTTEAALEGYADLVDQDMLKGARDHAVALRRLLDASGDVGSIRDAYQKLEAITFQIAEKIYGGDAPSGAGVH